MTEKYKLPWGVMAVLAMGSTAAFGQASAPLQLKALAATCANCHGTQGRAVSGSTVPSLAGLKQDAIVEQMKAFKSGQRPATVMHQLAKGYSDEQIEQIAGYFASQRP